VLQSLVDSLPREAKIAVETKIEQSTPAPVAAQAPAPVVTQSAPAPAVAAVTVPLAQAVAPASVIPTNPAGSQPTAPAMPAAPVFDIPVAAPAAAAPAAAAPAAAAAPVAPVEVPFNDSQTMTQYVLNVYREIGPQRASGIQAVLNQIGVVNINDVKPEQYAQLYTGIEAVRKAQ
jgi:hypothetical protein